MTPSKPNFIIIGSAKCGTTTLATILERHPDCCFSRPKEVFFFQDVITSGARLWSRQAGFSETIYGKDEINEKGKGPNPNLKKGWDWYRKAWAHYNGESLVGEATPDYADRTNSPNTAANICAFNPEMKIIYMVREPLARMVSHWQMWRRHVQGGLTDYHEAPWAVKGFEAYLGSRPDREAFWDETRYHYQLQPYLEHFGRGQVLVSFLEDWSRNQDAEIKRIFHFLGLDASKLEGLTPKAVNVGRDLAMPSKLQRAVAQSRLRPMLRAIIGTGLWTRLAAKYAWVPYEPAVPELKSATLRNFLDYVRADNRLFLGEWGKDPDYWAPARVKLVEHDVPKSDRLLVTAR